LESMQRLASQSTLKILWKTMASPMSHRMAAKRGNASWYQAETINGWIRDWFQQQQLRQRQRQQNSTKTTTTTTTTNLYLLDWGRQVLPRSVGTLDATLEGDMFPHWGVEARLLLTQMVTHAIQLLF